MNIHNKLLKILAVTENGTMDSLLNHQATENPCRVSFVYTKVHNDIMVIVAEADNEVIMCSWYTLKVRENTFVDIATDIMIVYITVLLDPGGANP